MDWFDILVILHLIVQFLLFIFVVILNGTFMLALVKKRALHAPSNAALGCLCCSDLLIGILTMPVWALNTSIIHNESLYDSTELFVEIAKVYWIFSGFSSLFVMLVNLDRYAAICHPFTYMQHATAKLYVVTAISACAIYALMVGFAYLVDKLYDVYCTGVIYIMITSITTLILVYCTWKIFNVIRRHRREIASVENMSNGQPQGRFQRETKRHHTIILLVALHFICKMPHIISYMLVNMHIVPFNIVLLIVSAASDNLLLLNSLLNPLVYYFSVAIFRAAMKAVLRCKSSVQNGASLQT